MTDKMSWVDEKIKNDEVEKNDGYFNMNEGDNRIQILSHCAPLPLVWTGSQYRPAEEGDKNVSIKGLCWVLQDGKIKQAKLPYTVVKSIRELQNDSDYTFSSFPMPRLINIKAKGAGTKEVVYTVIPSPKETEVSEDILSQLAEKPTPEDIVELIKEKASGGVVKEEYPQDEINPEDIPF